MMKHVRTPSESSSWQIALCRSVSSWSLCKSCQQMTGASVPAQIYYGFGSLVPENVGKPQQVHWLIIISIKYIQIWQCEGIAHLQTDPKKNVAMESLRFHIKMIRNE